MTVSSFKKTNQHKFPCNRFLFSLSENVEISQSRGRSVALRVSYDGKSFEIFSSCYYKGNCPPIVPFFLDTSL